MALIKRVELLGFKSFPERTVVDFSAGISAVVGPNGCGKSNVVDAVRWVLGEQNPRALRAERMEDVIFGGTESRSRVSVAEVTMVMDNSDRTLPLDVSEVELRRRLFRSGDSEYLVNRQVVRLRDLREIFLDTGVGKNAYSVMEQGRIDLLLAAKPEQRRQVFEEAAGIARYRTRAAEADRKLHHTRQNMSQVNAIIAEVKRSRDVLANQVERASQYRNLQERIFGAERDLELIRLRELQTRRAAIEADLATARERQEQLQEKSRRAQEALHNNTDHTRTLEAEVVEMKRQLYGVDLQRGDTKERMTSARERVAEAERSMAGYRDRERGVAARIVELQQLREARQAAAAEAHARVGELRGARDAIGTEIEDLQARVRDNAAAEKEANAAVLEEDKRLEQLRERLRTTTDDIVSSLDTGLQAAGYSPEARAAAEEQIARLLEELHATLAEDGDAGEAQERLRTARRQVSELDGLIKSYGTLTSTVIDDFLSPQGIVTQKRQLDEELGAAVARIAQQRRRAADARRDNEKLADRIDGQRRRAHDLQVESTRSAALHDSLNAECEQLTGQIAEQQSRRGELARDEQNAAQSIAALNQSLHDLEARGERLAEQETELRARLGQLDGELKKQTERHAAHARTVQKLQEQLQRAAGGIEKLQLRDAEVATEIRTTLRTFQEVHAKDLSQFELDITQSESRSELRATLARLREEVRNLGQVNLMAAEQFREVNERYQFLRGQLDDLETATRDLSQIAEQIHAESSTLFRQAFADIRREFQAMFRRLFGGGRTELKLTDPEALLESGIEFYAQPPGKKLENITLLSGGERALTAVALLFALYRIRPSPFCVLDEIDAALDDENVGRLVELLTEFSADTQFLVVTHNKRTAAGASHLFGITMEEQGVSRLVTLRLPSAERSPEPELAGVN
jgi:chromosome segregation protein